MSTWEKSANPSEAELENREGLTSIAMVQCVRYMPQKFVSQSVKVLAKRVWSQGVTPQRKVADTHCKRRTAKHR